MILSREDVVDIYGECLVLRLKQGGWRDASTVYTRELSTGARDADLAVYGVAKHN